jgi:uncharacterized membrane protein
MMMMVVVVVMMVVMMIVFVYKKVSTDVSRVFRRSKIVKGIIKHRKIKCKIINKTYK